MTDQPHCASCGAENGLVEITSPLLCERCHDIIKARAMIKKEKWWVKDYEPLYMDVWRKLESLGKRNTLTIIEFVGYYNKVMAFLKGE